MKKSIMYRTGESLSQLSHSAEMKGKIRQGVRDNSLDTLPAEPKLFGFLPDFIVVWHPLVIVMIPVVFPGPC
jgi:hypothetical protein